MSEDELPVRPRSKAGKWQVFRDGLAALGPDRKWLAVTALLAVITGILETLLLFLMARVAVALTSGDKEVTIQVGPLAEQTASVSSLVMWAALALALAIVISVPLSRILATLSARAVVRMRSDLIESYLASSWAYRSEHREGYLQQLMGEYCNRAENAVQQLNIVIVSVCSVAMVCLGAVIASPIASAVGGVALVVVGVFLRPLSRRVRKSSLRNAVVSTDVINRVAQTARMSEEIAAFNVGTAVSDELIVDIEDASGSLWRVRHMTRLIPILYQYSALGIMLLLIGVVSFFEIGGLAGVAPLILLMIRALTYLRQLLSASQFSLELAPYIEAVGAQIDTMRANEQPVGGVAVDRFTGVTLQDVSYEYVAGQPVLHDISFDLRPGEVLGVVGPSGGGKTTLTQLILRLRLPSKGTILAGSVDLADVDPRSWSRLTAFVPQENKLILATVADNIRFFRPGFSLEQVEAAARAAHLHDEITELPEGYLTLIGPSARGLSGGQRQRLGIARALLGSPELLVLDEPTSALDSRSEELIRVTLSELKGSTSVLLVAHRPATLEVCDRVLRIEHGRGQLRPDLLPAE
ncbi:MAG: ABC transporter ATP-binding protein [Acidimicrobiales bacterium]